MERGKSCSAATGVCAGTSHAVVWPLLRGRKRCRRSAIVFLHDHFVQDSGLNAYTNAFYMTLTILGGVPYGNMALHSGIEKGFTMILIGVGFKLLFAWVYRSTAGRVLLRELQPPREQGSCAVLAVALQFAVGSGGRDERASD